MAALILLLRIAFLTSALVLAVYAVRHFLFSAFRVFFSRPREFSELEGYILPRVTVIVPMHNEASVAEASLSSLIDSDYDPALLEIIAVNDRSQDGTAAIIDSFASRFPQVKALHRTAGNGGKPGVLEFATRQAGGEVIIVFDADYTPGRGVVKMLVAPFADPQIGAVMGRVVPLNSHQSLLSNLLSLERAAGYQVNQQARFGLGLVPQFGGTVGGVRTSALRALGGWNTQSITEDTELTCRLVIHGWKVHYVNRAECYEEVPETWKVRSAQLRRWVIGHNDCFHRFAGPVLRSRFLSLRERIDLLLLLACYWTAPLMMIGWLSSAILFLSRQVVPADAFGIALLLVGTQMFSSQSSLAELVIAGFLDQEVDRLLLLPLSLLNFAASTGAVLSALGVYYSKTLLGRREFGWHKTIRSGSKGNGSGNGHGTGNGSGGQEAPGA
jgi:cellulose synthase/poly-beta-1,6-N-acetylglucosamine synthase-like glycosyltransferase